MSRVTAPTAAPDFDTGYFRHALGQFATGITVLITQVPDRGLHGLTVSSFNSVSLDPPLVLWSLANTARSMPVFAGASHYIINVLAEHQQELALRFSRPGNRFESLEYHRSRTGLPILPGVAAWFECRNRTLPRGRPRDLRRRSRTLPCQSKQAAGFSRRPVRRHLERGETI